MEQVEAKADPKRPYKMYATMLSAFLTSLIFSDWDLPVWVKALLMAVVCALSVYLTPNPINVKRSRTVKVGANNDPTLFD